MLDRMPAMIAIPCAPFRGAYDADWREDQHKRDEGGKFSSTGAGGGARGGESEPSLRQMLGGGERRFGRGAAKAPGSKLEAKSEKRIAEKSALKKLQRSNYSGAVNAASEWLEHNGSETSVPKRELSPEQIEGLRKLSGDLLKILRNAGHAQVSEAKVAEPAAKEKKPKAKPKTLPMESMETVPVRRRAEISAKPKAEKKPKAPASPEVKASYIKRLEEAGTGVGSHDKMEPLIWELRTNKSLTKPDIDEIAKAYTGGRDKYKSKKAAIDAIFDRYEERVYQTSKMKIVERYKVG